MTSDKCSCGARDKAKCSKENGLGSGKMCLKPEDGILMYYLHCTYCDKKIFKTEINPKPKVGDVLIAEHWKYIDDSQVEIGDRFFCPDCLAEFQPTIEKVKSEHEPNI